MTVADSTTSMTDNDVGLPGAQPPGQNEDDETGLETPSYPSRFSALLSSRGAGTALYILGRAGMAAAVVTFILWYAEPIPYPAETLGLISLAPGSIWFVNFVFDPFAVRDALTSGWIPGVFQTSLTLVAELDWILIPLQFAAAGVVAYAGSRLRSDRRGMWVTLGAILASFPLVADPLLLAGVAFGFCALHVIRSTDVPEWKK